MGARPAMADWDHGSRGCQGAAFGFLPGLANSSRKLLCTADAIDPDRVRRTDLPQTNVATLARCAVPYNTSGVVRNRRKPQSVNMKLPSSSRPLLYLSP